MSAFAETEHVRHALVPVLVGWGEAVSLAVTESPQLAEIHGW